MISFLPKNVSLNRKYTLFKVSLNIFDDGVQYIIHRPEWPVSLKAFYYDQSPYSSVRILFLSPEKLEAIFKCNLFLDRPMLGALTFRYIDSDDFITLSLYPTDPCSLLEIDVQKSLRSIYANLKFLLHMELLKKEFEQQISADKRSNALTCNSDCITFGVSFIVDGQEKCFEGLTARQFIQIDQKASYIHINTKGSKAPNKGTSSIRLVCLASKQTSETLRLVIALIQVLLLANSQQYRSISSISYKIEANGNPDLLDDPNLPANVPSLLTWNLSENPLNIHDLLMSFVISCQASFAGPIVLNFFDGPTNRSNLVASAIKKVSLIQTEVFEIVPAVKPIRVKSFKVFNISLQNEYLYIGESCGLV